MNTEIDDSIVLDAMRYRWLRHGDNDEKVLKTYTSRPSEPGEPTMFLPRNDELDRLIDAARAARAPADSVLEDAARLDFLIEQRAYVVSDPDTCPGYWLHFVHKETGKCWVQCDEHPTPRAAIDAARKQGANHD